MSADGGILYYPVGRAIGFCFFGVLLLFVTILMFSYGFVGVFIIFGFILGGLAIFRGIRALTTRKKYPMSLGAEFLTFFRKGQEVRITVKDLKRIWFNMSGIDKRVSLALVDGKVIDVPVLYGLDDLRKKLQNRYGIGDK